MPKLVEYPDLKERYERFLRYRKSKTARGKKTIAQNTIEKYWWHVLGMLNWKGGDPQDWSEEKAKEYYNYLWQIYKQNSIIPISAAINHYWAMIRKDYYFPIPETEEIDIKPLTEMEIEKIIQCAKNDSFSYALLLTLKDTIQRESDIRNIDIDDINFEELTITFKKTKGGKRHVAPITQRTADAIKKYIARDRVSPQGGSNALFVSKLGKRICKNVIEHRVKYYTQKARIEKRVYPHLFRHSGITIMDKNGVSPKTGMAISGHRDEKSYLRYCHPDRQHIRKEFERTIGNNYHPNEIANNFTTVTPSVYIKEQNFSDEDLERLLTIRLATGAIDSETYKLALAQLKKNASKEKI